MHQYRLVPWPSSSLPRSVIPENPARWLELACRAHYNSVELAKVLGYSTRQLSRCCRREFGLSTQQWLEQQRLTAAVELLKQSQLVKTVAFELGFKQVSHFSRKFKVCFGRSPSQFKGDMSATDNSFPLRGGSTGTNAGIRPNDSSRP
jgi:AraC-like DNA-binding protein